MIEEFKKKRFAYHYTSFDTLFTILENYRNGNDKRHLSFRATNIFNVNDPTEIEAGYEMIKRWLPLYEDYYNVSGELRLSELLNDSEVENSIRDRLLCHKDKKLLNHGIVPYIACFSSLRDYLPMWSLYGKNGTGVCLKFDMNKFVDWNLEYQLGFVSYKKNSIIKSIREIDRVQTLLGKSKTASTINDKISILSELCESLAPFIKYKDYEYEKEIRAVYYKSYGLSPEDITAYSYRYPIKEYVIEDFVYLPVNAASIKEIIIGPCANNKAMTPILKREFDACKLNVKISNSSVPFRIS